MAKVSKKLQQQIVEAIRQAHSGVVDQFLPECTENPPDLWSAEQTLKYDMLTDAEMKSVAAVEAVLNQ